MPHKDFMIQRDDGIKVMLSKSVTIINSISSIYPGGEIWKHTCVSGVSTLYRAYPL